MKKEQIKTFATKLIEEASLLQQRVKEYYNGEESTLAFLLGKIAEHLENLDREKLKGDMVGIYRIVSDSSIEESELGKDLYAFNDRLEEIIAMLEKTNRG